MTINTVTLNISTKYQIFSIVRLHLISLGAMTLSMKTLSIMTLSRIDLTTTINIATLNINIKYDIFIVMLYLISVLILKCGPADQDQRSHNHWAP
jgi:hypothetical protein